jgi:hypothetical protein
VVAISFGFGVADIAGSLKWIWNVWQNTKKACGEHCNLAREVATYHATLEQLLSGLEDPQSQLSTASNDYQTELQGHIEGCQEQLQVLDSILLKYPALNSKEVCISKTWQKIVFANTDVTVLEEIRRKISTFTSAIQISLQLLSNSELSRMRGELSTIRQQTDDLPEIKESLAMIVARMLSASRGGSATSDFTVYSNDDRRFWKTLRQELVKAGFTSEVLKQGNRKKLIMTFVAKLCQTGALDRGGSQVSLGIYGGDEDVQDLASPASSFDNGNSVNTRGPNEPEPTEIPEMDPVTQYLLENAILVQLPTQPGDTTASGLDCKGKKRPSRTNDANDKKVNPASKNNDQAPQTNVELTPPIAPPSSPSKKPRTPVSGPSPTKITSTILLKASSPTPLTKASAPNPTPSPMIKSSSRIQACKRYLRYRYLSDTY